MGLEKALQFNCAPLETNWMHRRGSFSCFACVDSEGVAARAEEGDEARCLTSGFCVFQAGPAVLAVGAFALEDVATIGAVDDLVFANKVGKALDRHNLLHRHVKPVADRLGLDKTIDFRSFRTMHASLMRRFGARLEVARDNMGHAGSSGSITLDVYSKTWWNERIEAVSRIVEAVFAEPDEEENRYSAQGPPERRI
jgi:hypothetical protein